MIFTLVFLLNTVECCKPLSKLDLPTLRQGSRERKSATEQIKNASLARIRTQALDLSRRCSTH